jgi:hypothetical protein
MIPHLGGAHLAATAAVQLQLRGGMPLQVAELPVAIVAVVVEVVPVQQPL